MIIENEPIENYHEHPAVSHSKLEVLRKCPLLYYKTYIDKSVQREETDSLKLGTALHCMALDGMEEYQRRYIVLPTEAPRRPTKAQVNAKKPAPETIEQIRFWQEWDKRHGHKIELTMEEQATIANAHEALNNHKRYQEYEGGDTETTLRQPYSDLFEIQSRIDLWEKAGRVLIDLKTVRDFDQFEYNYHTFGYHRQAEFYQSMVHDHLPAFHKFYFVAVEMKEPYRVGFFEPDANSLTVASEENRSLLECMNQCMLLNQWPGAPEAITPIGLPPYYKRKDF